MLTCTSWRQKNFSLVKSRRLSFVILILFIKNLSVSVFEVILSCFNMFMRILRTVKHVKFTQGSWCLQDLFLNYTTFPYVLVSNQCLQHFFAPKWTGAVARKSPDSLFWYCILSGVFLSYFSHFNSIIICKLISDHFTCSLICRKCQLNQLINYSINDLRFIVVLNRWSSTIWPCLKFLNKVCLTGNIFKIDFFWFSSFICHFTFANY